MLASAHGLTSFEGTRGADTIAPLRALDRLLSQFEIPEYGDAVAQWSGHAVKQAGLKS